MEKVLMLGGSKQQLPILKKAKDMGCCIVLCDYLPNNPGRDIADEYCEISTTDKDEVLRVARTNNVNGILDYASDPAAPTAAYVAESLGLPGNSTSAVNALANKYSFRQLQKRCGLNVPRFAAFEEKDRALEYIRSHSLPLVVKPTDSSGSKGVAVLQSYEGASRLFDDAKDQSQEGRVIVESFISTPHRQLHGDGIVINGQLELCFLGDHYYREGTSAPISTIWPSSISYDTIERVEDDVQKLISTSEFKNGSINIEARVNRGGDVYIVEVGPRAGGNYVPVLLTELVGVDFLEANISLCLGRDVSVKNFGGSPEGAYYVVSSSKSGELKNVNFGNRAKKYLIDYYSYKESGEKVEVFTNASDAVGVCLFRRPSSGFSSGESFFRLVNGEVSVEVD
jgi:biotin carboxylase